MHTSLNSSRATLFPGSAVLTIAAVTACWPQAVRAQNSSEALAEAFVESVRAEDRAGLRALVHPAVRTPLPEARVRGAVDAWLDPEVVHAAAPHEGRWYILLPGAPGG